uniref:Uncharacterized protein n=1 Tax=Chromera velia CCMP2878 TaxID=1169474 RepID=A0A0G4HRM2_9ALVE|eukprot:Cvel_1278.t1-p1 / transcript=Cvel_1278.t1 / gene=Cvel_1278 / organism=Chromera_velia_CCMP2878 / gene_product=Ankyrin-1, putative / transcript_product=Ankyrin-1, putative / location=Cvel_scaffold43:24916-31040(-) / protein_length=370 / sequence_SO=supercontig / SO=protein_coding / is_pseudo=false
MGARRLLHWLAALAVLAVVPSAWGLTLRTDFETDSPANGKTALHIAAEEGDLASVIALLNSGRDANAKTIWKITPLHYAASAGHAHIVRRLLEHSGIEKEPRDWRNMSPLLAAVRRGHKETVIALLEGGADIEAHHYRQNNAVQIASRQGHLEILEELLKRGAEVMAKADDKDTALHLAALAGQVEVAGKLIDSKTEVNDSNQRGETPLHLAADKGHFGMVSFLLDQGAQVDAKDIYGDCALLKASLKGHTDVVSILLDKGADPNVMDLYGNSPLHQAAKAEPHWASVSTMTELIRRGADVNISGKRNGTSDHDSTPLFVATREKNSAAVRFLLENGAKTELKGYEGKSPMDLAVEKDEGWKIREMLMYY